MLSTPKQAVLVVTQLSVEYSSVDLKLKNTQRGSGGSC